MSTKCILWCLKSLSWFESKPLLQALYASPDIFFPCLVFLMTCKPPLYMGPEYIKYFNDKTIDVSSLPLSLFLGSLVGDFIVVLLTQ